MDLLLIALLLLAVGAVVAVGLGKVGGGMAPAQPEAVPALDAPVTTPEDLDRARFTLALRGYRMDQVDTVLDEARDLIAAKDAEIDRLREQLAHRDRPDERVALARPEERPADPRPDERVAVARPEERPAAARSDERSGAARP